MYVCMYVHSYVHTYICTVRVYEPSLFGSPSTRGSAAQRPKLHQVRVYVHTYIHMYLLYIFIYLNTGNGTMARGSGKLSRVENFYAVIRTTGGGEAWDKSPPVSFSRRNVREGGVVRTYGMYVGTIREAGLIDWGGGQVVVALFHKLAMGRSLVRPRTGVLMLEGR
jgi:hypothetical protein